MDNFFLIQSTLYFQEVVKIKNAFEKESINFVFLKGLPLHLYFEKTHPKRIYLDCDVLVAKKDFVRAEKILRKEGYKKANTKLSKTHEEMKNKEVENAYIKVINNLPVVFDLHLEAAFLMTQLGRLEALYPQSLIDQFTKELLATKKEVKINNQYFLILDTKYLILYLALHLFHHNFSGAFRYQFLDTVITKEKLAPITVKYLTVIIKNYQLQNFVHPVFVLLKKYYQTPVPSSLLKSIQPVNPLTRKLVNKIIKNCNIFDDQPRISAGITRFKNLFCLSPNPLWKKIFVFFNPQVLYSILWLIMKRLKRFFSFLSRKSVH